MAVTLDEVRVGWDGVLRLLVVEPWEASYLVGDATCSLRMFVAPTFPVLPQFSVINVRVNVMKNGLRALELIGPIQENGRLRTLESCGTIMFAQSSKRFLAIRNYHTNAFIDVQFKLKAAFEGRIPTFSPETLLLTVALWSDDELKWICEWQLVKIWPYVTADRIKSWTSTMRRLDPAIKTLYRGCKAELAARASRGASVANSSWGFPKGGCKVVRSRLETAREAAARELHEETGLVLGDADVRTVDILRDHGRTFDRWFVCVLPEEATAQPGSWDVAAAQWLPRSEISSMPHLARFSDCLACIEEGRALPVLPLDGDTDGAARLTVDAGLAGTAARTMESPAGPASLERAGGTAAAADSSTGHKRPATPPDEWS